MANIIDENNMANVHLNVSYGEGAIEAGGPATWKAAAFELWLDRARRRAETRPLTLLSLCCEVKRWKPEKLPPGVTNKAYVKEVVHELKNCSQLVHNPSTGTFLPISPSLRDAISEPPSSITAHSTAYVHGTATSTPDTNFSAGTTPAAPQRTAESEIEYWVFKIHNMSQPRLPLSALLKEVKARAPREGYKGPGGEPLSDTRFYKFLKKALKRDARITYDKTKGQKGFMCGTSTSNAASDAHAGPAGGAPKAAVHNTAIMQPPSSNQDSLLQTTLISPSESQVSTT
jgi:hypothetical protein